MVRTRNLAAVPLWLLVVAAAVLLALLAQARPVVAPTLTLLPSTSAAVTSAPSPAPVSNVVSQRAINVSKPVAPAPAAPVTGQQAEAPPAGPAVCPTQPGSGIPCSQP